MSKYLATFSDRITYEREYAVLVEVDPSKPVDEQIAEYDIDTAIVNGAAVEIRREQVETEPWEVVDARRLEVRP